MSEENIKQFQHEILSWYAKHKRDLPWRRTRNPYHILVSEIMSQQTQISRVIPKYEAWMAAFPTIESLAEAKKEDILRLWSGLGYNRRALYLQKTAQAVLEHLRRQGCWPMTVEELEKLPGIGPYTARAIACFAFDQQVAVVDANVRKIILLKCSNKQKVIGNKEMQVIADTLLPVGKAYDWNQALMDYASCMLQKEKVPTKKQSTFKHSNRYYRGKLVRLLLAQKELAISAVGKLLRDDFSEHDNQWRDTLLRNMVKDGLIVEKNGKISL